MEPQTLNIKKWSIYKLLWFYKLIYLNVDEILVNFIFFFADLPLRNISTCESGFS